MPENTHEEERRHLHELIGSFDTAMLVTRTAEGHLRSRPLAIAEQREDDGLYFATRIDSPKVQELEEERQVNVCMQDEKRFVSMSGTARVVRDRALIDRLWKAAWTIWFPNGKDDPALCLVLIEPEEAEYWDQGGTKGIRYLFRQAKGLVTGDTPAKNGQENAKVRL